MPGDLWILGDHRLLVRAATDSGTVTKLMAGGTADLVFTDPPYNVDYEGYTEECLKIKGDRMSDADFKKFLEAAFLSHRTVVKPGASNYVCHFLNELEAAGFEVCCRLICAKSTFACGFGGYKFQHEPMFWALPFCLLPLAGRNVGHSGPTLAFLLAFSFSEVARGGAGYFRNCIHVLMPIPVK